MPKGAPKNLAIKEEAAVSEVVKIVMQTAEHLLNGVGITIVKGGVGGDAGTYLIEVVVAGIHLLDLIYEILTFRTVADKRHVANKYIPKLRKLVKMVITDETTYLRKARVSIDVEELGLAIGLGIGRHGTELVNVKGATVLAYTFLAENCIASVLELDGYEANEEEG